MDRNGADRAQPLGRQTVDLGESQKRDGEGQNDEPQAEVRGHPVVARPVVIAVEDAEPDGEGDCRQDDHDDLA